MTTDTTVSNLIINTLTRAQYATITPSATELYMVDDDTIGGAYTATCPAITISSGEATWSITHNLGTQNVIVTLYDSSGKEIIKNVTVTSANVISVKFKSSSNVTAGSYKIVIIGA